MRLLDFGIQGIFSREEALARLKKLAPGKKAIPDVMKRMREVEEVVG